MSKPKMCGTRSRTCPGDNSCAWWHVDECVFKSIARSLYDIEDHLHWIDERQRGGRYTHEDTIRGKEGGRPPGDGALREKRRIGDDDD